MARKPGRSPCRSRAPARRLTDLTTRASIDGDVCRINGAKTFCSYAGLNDHILLFCRFAPATAGIGAVILDRDTPGLTISKPTTTWVARPGTSCFWTTPRFPSENVLFEGNAFRKLMGSYSLERTAAGAWAIGVAQAAFEMARDYSLERKQFGRPICEFQLVQGRLADMWLRLEQARWLVYKACVDADGTASRLESSMAKVAGDRGRGLRHRPGHADVRRQRHVAGNAAGMDVSHGAALHRGRRHVGHPPRHDRQRDPAAPVRS